MIIVASYSPDMFADIPSTQRISEVPIALVKELKLESRIGWVHTANMLGCLLERDLEANRSSVHLDKGEALIYAKILAKNGLRYNEMTPLEIQELTPKRDYDCQFYLIEVI